MTAYATLAGHPCTDVRVHVPARGPWWADVTFEGAPDVSGRVSLALGALELSGTIDASHDGTHGLQRRSRVIAGAGGWATLLPAKAYHNDAQIRALTVAQDAAREAGETLSASFAPAYERVGIDYVRQAGPASRVLEDVIGGAAWWVDYDGTTQVGERPTSDASPDDYEVLEHEPAEHVVTLAVDDLRTVGIGSVLSERLDAPQTVRELEIDVTAERVRVKAWTGGEDGGHGRLDRAMRSIVARYTDARIFGSWRYRVIRMASDRVELQAVRRGAGLPDVLPVSMWPGVAGAHAELTPGAEVLVEFVEGDRTMPIVTHFAGRDGAGWAPRETVIAVADPGELGGKIRLGSSGAHEPVALAPRVSERIDKIQAALDAFCAAVPGTQDGGAALQAALSAVWGPGVPPTEPSDVRSLCVLAERGAPGTPGEEHGG